MVSRGLWSASPTAAFSGSAICNIISSFFSLSGHSTNLIVESILNWRTNAEIASKPAFRCLSEDMCARVPKDLLAFGVVKWQKLQLAALLKWALKIPQCLLWCTLVQTCDDGALE